MLNYKTKEFSKKSKKNSTGFNDFLIIPYVLYILKKFCLTHDYNLYYKKLKNNFIKTRGSILKWLRKN